MLSFGILSALALSIAVFKAALYSGSAPPSLAATVIALACLVNTDALFASCFQAIWSNYLFHISSILFTFYLFIHALNEPYICYTEQHAEIHEEEIIPPNSCPEPPVITPTSETELSPVFPALPEKYLKNLGIKREKMKNELVQLFDENVDRTDE